MRSHLARTTALAQFGPTPVQFNRGVRHGFCTEQTSSNAWPNGTVQRPHQRSIQRNWLLKFPSIRRSAPCRAFEEKIHLPTALVDLGNGQCWKREVVGQQLESLLRFYIEVADSTQR